MVAVSSLLFSASTFSAASSASALWSLTCAAVVNAASASTTACDLVVASPSMPTSFSTKAATCFMSTVSAYSTVFSANLPRSPGFVLSATGSPPFNEASKPSLSNISTTPVISFARSRHFWPAIVPDFRDAQVPAMSDSNSSFSVTSAARSESREATLLRATVRDSSASATAFSADFTPSPFALRSCVAESAACSAVVTAPAASCCCTVIALTSVSDA
mmetsp:Transcript_64318/g.104035  ORF Transcript_64318/g.104035 Transcript_64318/m.104035 type:complete len:218 (+) Transcript_64318:371-1024(+)